MIIYVYYFLYYVLITISTSAEVSKGLRGCAFLFLVERENPIQARGEENQELQSALH